MKKPSSRSQRGGSKGIKGKHILQICVLLGVCIWLIYQVKYSHDKKKEFYERDGKKSTVSLLTESEDGLVKLGRKDLLPGYHYQNEKEKHVEEEEDEEEKERKSKVGNVNHEDEEKEEEEEEVVDEDEEDKNKQGEEVVEEDEEENKHEEDEIDEQDQRQTSEDTDKDDELLEEEKGGLHERDEKEKEAKIADEFDMTVDEAREEHYKADDASSAVSHESRILKTENLKENAENSTETGQGKDSGAATGKLKIQREPVLKLREAERGNFVNITASEVKDGDSQSSNSETKSLVIESRGETFNGNSTEAIIKASGFSLNETESMRELSQEHDKTEAPSGSSDLQTVFKLEQARNESDLSITVSANITNKDPIQDESRNSTSESSLTENISRSNTTEVKENSRSEGDDESGENESSNLFSTEQTEEADDTSETTILQEEREALTDPQTLPDIRVEGSEEDEEEAIAAE